MKARRAKRSTAARPSGTADLRARLRRAEESLHATTEILKVISSSPSSVQPVFDAIIRSAVRLGDAQIGTLFRLEGNTIYVGAHCNLNTEAEALFRRVFPQPLNDGSPYGRAMLQAVVVNVPDLERSAPSEASRQRGRVLGTRAVLAVPMLAKDGVLGAIVIGRRAPGAFSESYVSLLKTFAAQAVIAIENVRLFNETKETLGRQKATAEILKVIAGSPSDVQPVFDAIVRSAAQLFAPCKAVIVMREGDRLYWKARAGPQEAPADLDELYNTLYPLPLDPARSVSARAIIERSMIYIPDTEAADVSEAARLIGRAAKHRSITIVPLLREGDGIGAIGIQHPDPSFELTDKQVALLRTFADQAVIAIENARLFNETKEALEQQTATAEILRVMSGSLTDIQPVVDVVAATAARLCEASDVLIQLRDGDLMHSAAHHGPIPVAATRPVSPKLLLGQVVLEGRQIQMDDIQKEDELYPESAASARRLGFHTILHTPLMRAGKAIGIITMRRMEVKPFNEKQKALVRTFADQAVIAIENVRLFNETKEALERQTATSEILKVISQTRIDLEPVLDIVLKNARRLCGADQAVIFRADGDGNCLPAALQVTERANDIMEFYREHPIRPNRGSATGRAVLERRAIHIPDVLADSEYRMEYAANRNYRSILAVPMLREGSPIGVLTVTRVGEPRPFTDKQIALINTFGNQAVIAIENVRLFNETKEALEQQTAISDILQVISNSPTDVRPVLSAVAERAARLCDAEFVTMLMADGALLRATVNSSLTGEGLPDGTELIRIDRTYIAGRAAITGKTVHVEDVLPLIDSEFPGTRDNQRKTGYRTFLAVPLMRDKAAIGVIAAWRRVVRPFSDKQIALLETFADQAALAIENVRLFNETKEALERQTATSEVLKVISQTRIDLQPVLEIVLENARKLCSADRVMVLRPDADGYYRPEAIRLSEHGSDNVTHFQRQPITADRATAAGRALLERRAIHIPDALADPEYGRPELIHDGGWRSVLAVPMLREGSPIGVLTVSRVGEPRPFTDKQIELVTSFADQAVIAIENVRLFNETTEALEQLKASAEVLRVISSSVEDTQPVFDAILESCRRLFEGHIVGITTVGEDDAVHLAAYEGPGREGFEQHFPVPLSAQSGSGVAILERRVVHYPDCEAPGVPEYARRGSRFTGTRSVIFAPMLWEESGIGAIFVGREWSGPFSDKDVALLKTFADQAVIAIQNARLFREIHEKSRQLEVANQHKSEFLANMSHELRTPLNAIIGFTRIVMRRAKEQLEPKQYENLEKIHSSGQHLLQLINAILDLSKVEAGRVEVTAADVALGTVLEQCVKTVEPLVKAPAVRLLKEFDGELPQVYLDEEKLRQIVINLLSNAVKFTERGTVRVRAKCNGDGFSVAVADTGIGIPAEKLDHVFEEFAQADASSTRVYGGTGLGLTIARRLARLMGGDISAQSEPGVGSTFTLTLPVRYQALAEVRTEPPAQARA